MDAAPIVVAALARDRRAMIDVRALIGDIPTTTIELVARTMDATPINSFGEPVVEDADAIDVRAVVHPTNRRSRLRGPEADYARETITIYVLDVDAFDTVRANPAPLVTYGGRVYEVAAIADYAELGGLIIVEAELRDEAT